MNNRILAELEFDSLLNESSAQTQTGGELLDKYKSFLMTNESTCRLVNGFIKEAQSYKYDNGVNNVLERVVDYITMNKTSWALASVCESINSNNSSYNYINRNAAKQVEKLLEMDETDVVKYIKAGALKNVMFCESFRNIAKQVFKDSPIVESNADYTIVHPVSITENVGDGVCFEVKGVLYKMDDDKMVQEARWEEVSNTFKMISNILESNNTTVDGENIFIKAGKSEYRISESGRCTKIYDNKEQEMTVEQLRENNRLVLMAISPRGRHQTASLLESIALVCENYDNIVNMDNVSIYTTKNDQFVVIESGDNLYASLLASNHSTKWCINESAIDVVSFIKSKTNVLLNEQYQDIISNSIERVSEAEQESMKKELYEQKVSSLRDRIALLTEKFKNEPVKLAVLSKLAQDVSSL